MMMFNVRTESFLTSHVSVGPCLRASGSKRIARMDEGCNVVLSSRSSTLMSRSRNLRVSSSPRKSHTNLLRAMMLVRWLTGANERRSLVVKYDAIGSSSSGGKRSMTFRCGMEGAKRKGKATCRAGGRSARSLDRPSTALTHRCSPKQSYRPNKRRVR